MEEGAESPNHYPLFEASWGPPVPQHRMRREAGVSDILLGPKEVRGSCETQQLSLRTKSNHIPGLSEVDRVPQTGVFFPEQQGAYEKGSDQCPWGLGIGTGRLLPL